ncbi:MAG TPA: CheR family methyltransferase, partial [Candidatus Cybelea sp.]|nr:CheR family methyltransferase [Candidatus Cybelea sp.]
GIYDEVQLSAIPTPVLHQFFLHGKGSHTGRVRVVDPIRNAVVFEQLNLLGSPWRVRGPFDAIFLRNVMIYFDRAAQLKTLARIKDLLADDGLLFTGHAESLFYASHLFRAAGSTVYRKAEYRAP